MILPKQLEDSRLRFIKVGYKGKIPMEKKWSSVNNYAWDNPKFQNHLLSGGNYGIIGGYGKLVILDFDHPDFQAMADMLLPDTFTVLSGGKQLKHRYYYVDETFDKFPVKIKGFTVMDVQCIGGMVVGAGSLHTSGKRYIVDRDVPIAPITLSALEETFGTLWSTTKKERSRGNRIVLRSGDSYTIHKELKLSTVMKHLGMDTSKNPTQCPFHDSAGGKNFSWSDEGMWMCFNCQEKGNIVSLYAKVNELEYKEAEKELVKLI